MFGIVREQALLLPLLLLPPRRLLRGKQSFKSRRMGM